MIRVINILDNINPSSGVTNVVYTFQPKLTQKIKYDFIYFDDSDHEVRLGGSNYLRLSLKKLVLRDEEEINRLRSFIGTSQVIIHNHVLLFSHLIMPVFREFFPNSITIGHAHSSRLSNKKYKILRNKLLVYGIEGYYDEFWGCSNQALNCWFSTKHMLGKNKKIIYNPVDCSVISQVKEAKAKKIKSQNIIIGHVGRLAPEKNHLFLLEIAKNLKHKNYNFKVVFIGDGPEKKRLSRKINDYKLNCEVEHIPYLPKLDLYDRMIEFDIFVFPSQFEGLGTALIEAQLLGVYSLAHNKLPKETDLGNVKYLPLDSKTWTSEIIKIIESKKNLKKFPSLRECNFCLSQSSQDILAQYMSFFT